MDLDLPLLVFVAILAAVTAARSLRVKNKSFAVIGVAFVVAVVAGYLVVGASVGPWIFAAWFLVAMAPQLVMRLVVVALHRQRYVLARRLHLLAYALHPARAMREGVTRLSVLSHLERGEVDRAIEVLRRIVADKGQAAGDAKLELLRLEERWDELAEAVRAVTDDDVAKNPALVLAGMRAFAELGRLDEMNAWFFRHEARLAPAPFAVLRAIALLVLFAANGRPDDVRRLLGTQLPHLTAELVELWGATASFAAGDEAARARLAALSSARDGAVRRSAKIYLERGHLWREAPPSEADRARVAKVAERVEREDRFIVGDATRSRPVATWIIAGALLAMFGLTELRGGSTDLEVLFELGALWPASVIEDGELHRLFAPLVLHYGPVHLSMNLAGLLLLAPFVERSLGRLRYAFVYVASGLVGTSLYVLAVKELGTEPGVMVGASGCIMGMVGASAAVLLRGYRHERVLVAKRRFYAMLIIVLLQSIFDLITPQVSFFAHSVGAVTGFLLALVVWRPAMVASTSNTEG